MLSLIIHDLLAAYDKNLTKVICVSKNQDKDSYSELINQNEYFK